MKKIWQLVCLENNYDSYSSYFRDRVRYISYTLSALLLFVLGLYFNIDWVSGFCFVGLILLPYMGFLSRDNYREFAPKVWKIKDVRHLKGGYPVTVDRTKDRILFYEERQYLKGDSLEQVVFMEEGFVLSELSLENELIFDFGTAERNCIIVEEYVYKSRNFEDEFQKKRNQEAPFLRYTVYTDDLR
ncbi:hypothetical protein R4Y59_001771 [Enterococcus faecalis]|nr:hypothetical protein [Enterococcus faecalis]